jgi:hypothetical protein
MRQRTLAGIRTALAEGSRVRVAATVAAGESASERSSESQRRRGLY